MEVEFEFGDKGKKEKEFMNIKQYINKKTCEHVQHDIEKLFLSTIKSKFDYHLRVICIEVGKSIQNSQSLASIS